MHYIINMTNKIKKRLEHIRAQIKKECISYAEIAELQSLAKYIEPGDVELLQWAGIEEGKSMTKKELGNIIYDTLFQNTNYTQFKEIDDKIEWQEVGGDNGDIMFKLSGKVYKISIEIVE